MLGTDPDSFLADNSTVTAAIWIVRWAAEAGRASLAGSGRDCRSQSEVGMATLRKRKCVADHRGSLEPARPNLRDLGTRSIAGLAVGDLAALLDPSYGDRHVFVG